MPTRKPKAVVKGKKAKGGKSNVKPKAKLIAKSEVISAGEDY